MSKIDHMQSVQNWTAGSDETIPSEYLEGAGTKARQEFFIGNCGRQVPAVNTAEEVRAVIKDKPDAAKPIEAEQQENGLRTDRNGRPFVRSAQQLRYVIPTRTARNR
jgi:hypothetical protein